MSVRAHFRNVLTHPLLLPPLSFLFCSCTSSFKGERCLLFYVDHSHSLPELEELVAISLGVAMFILILAIITCCIVRR